MSTKSSPPPATGTKVPVTLTLDLMVAAWLQASAVARTVEEGQITSVSAIANEYLNAIRENDDRITDYKPLDKHLKLAKTRTHRYVPVGERPFRELTPEQQRERRSERARAQWAKRKNGGNP